MCEFLAVQEHICLALLYCQQKRVYTHNGEYISISLDRGKHQWTIFRFFNHFN